jgi:hypothetical protein
MTAKPSALCRYLLIQFVRPRVSAEDYARSCLKSGLWSAGVADLYVLDTSSIFAFTDQEEGADEIERLLDEKILLQAAMLKASYRLSSGVREES